MSATTTYRGEPVTEPKETVKWDCGRWRWDLWWDEGDGLGRGVGGWSRTVIAARLFMWLEKLSDRKRSADA